MSGQIEKHNAATFAERVNAALNNMIVHFDSDETLNEKLDEIKCKMSNSVLDNVKDGAAFLCDNYGGRGYEFRNSIGVDVWNSLTANKQANTVGNTYFDDPMKMDSNICAYRDAGNAEEKAYYWDFFKDDDSEASKNKDKIRNVIIADVIVVRGDLTLDNLAKCVAECFFKLYKNGRMPQRSKNQKYAYSYTGKIGSVKINSADTPYYLVGFSITQAVL